ncbi:hypothetical protein [Desulfatibacillum alkenivorans]|jgi:hypothetical protein|uniref:hypothetical protein n=1 Tax=Desulfatibacillum alkenivorans TaxID=259354 RepID=UPI00111495D9|nr:hypothetical protein [Desulfatibacillum alkenivorans]
MMEKTGALCGAKLQVIENNRKLLVSLLLSWLGRGLFFLPGDARRASESNPFGHKIDRVE